MARDTDLSHLHPLFRSKLADLCAAVASAGLALQIYEGARSPQRQMELYSQGRVSGVGTSGHYVTKAKPWQSFHQFGLAADLVFFIDGAWTWKEPNPGDWDKYTQIAASVGLRTLSFERPHVELPTSMVLLSSGQYPAGGDQSWIDWLDSAIEGWGHDARTVDQIVFPGAPPMPSGSDRPVLAA